MSEYLSVLDLFAYDITKCDSDWHVTEDFANFYRLYFVLDGEAYFESETSRVKLIPNTLYIFPLYKKYEIYHNPRHPLYCFWCHVNLNVLALNDLIHIATQANSALSYTLEALSELIIANTDSNIVKASLNSLLSIISSDVKPYLNVIDKRLDVVINYIHCNYSEQTLNNTQLSKLINMDTRYFIRLFKNNLNQTPHAYISSYRAFKAVNLLLSGYNVCETSTMVGFCDTKAFSRFFKNHYNISPSKISKSYFWQP